MDQCVKIAMASGVLLGGILLALMFRHPSPQTETPGNRIGPKSGDRVLVTEHAPPPDRPESSNPAPNGRTAVRPKPTILRQTNPVQRPPVQRPPFQRPPFQRPPVLAEDYSTGTTRSRPKTPARWGTSIGMNLPKPVSAEMSTTWHKVVDGDSLQSLAERYLGSADRYLEIYKANRDVLPGPNVLLIGVKLKIPHS